MRGGASLPRMMVERISTFEPGRSVGGFHQTLELGSIHVATFDEARRHFVDLALVLRQSFRARDQRRQSIRLLLIVVPAVFDRAVLAALQQASHTGPIVFAAVIDPV